MKIKQEGLFIESKYSGFRAENIDQFLGYEAGQFDGASSAFDTVANWIEEDLGSGSFDPKRYIETLRRPLCECGHKSGRHWYAVEHGTASYDCRDCDCLNFILQKMNKTDS